MKILEILIHALRFLMHESIDKLGINHEKIIEISKRLDIFILKKQIN